MKSYAKKLFLISSLSLNIIVLYLLLFNNRLDISKYTTNFYSNTLNITKECFSKSFLDIINSIKSIEENKLHSNGRNFRINTKSCKIIDLPLYDEETKGLFENKSETLWKCRKTTINITRFNETDIRIDYSKLKSIPLCYYRQLTRVDGEKLHFRYGWYHSHYAYGLFRGPINPPTLSLPDYELVHILCYNNRLSVNERKVSKNYNQSDPDIIHNQIIPLIPFVNKTSHSLAPNVLLLAIDSVSYLNFRRHFIRTKPLLDKHHFLELRGYNKVGANTFPNMIPFLTGHISREIVPDDRLKFGYFDNWPIIWKQYSQHGFITQFLEEMSWCGLFHFNLWGFEYKPTDYQTRPFHMEIRNIKHNYFCYNGKTETEHSLDYTLDFVRAMNKRGQKYFAYISISEMTHDWINGGHYMDVPYHSLLSQLFDEHLLDNTVVMIFSDHGFRYGKLRKTHTGEVENRLPFMFIRLPQTIDKTSMANMATNQYRLTSAFDIHATLTHLIEGKPNASLPHGLSLLTEIREDRTCAQASIPYMFCSCYEDIEVQDMDVIKANHTIDRIVDKINSMTKNVRQKCCEYKFHSIYRVYNRRYSTADDEYLLGDSQFFIIQVYVMPGMALFETIVRSFRHNSWFEIIGDITRINRYANQSHCIEDKILNNYCFCRDLLKPMII